MSDTAISSEISPEVCQEKKKKMYDNATLIVFSNNQ